MTRVATLFGGTTPETPVAFGPDRVVSAATLRGAARRVAEALSPAREGEEIVVLARDRVVFAAALCGAWEAGYGVALAPNAQPETLRAICGRPGVRTVVHDGEGDRGVDVGALVREARALDSPYPALPPERHLATVYTSGSTGEHRACAKSARQLLGEVAVLLEAFGDVAGARTLAVVPPHHIYGLLFGVLLPLSSGGAFLLGSVPHAASVAESLVRHRIDVLVSVPAHLAAMRAMPDLPPVRRVFSSGAPLAGDVAEDLARAGWCVTEVLGSSETGGIAWRERGAPWQPLPSVRVAVDAEERLLVDSPMLADDAGRPYRTTDRARLLSDGRFEHLGRADGVLKIGSRRVSVAEIERHLLRIDGVLDAAVLAVEVGGARGSETWAALVAPGVSVASVRAALRRWLEPVVLPRRYRFVESLPRRDTGKIRAADLRALFEGER